MDGRDLQVLAAVREWTAAGHGVTLVTVARTWGSAPRPPGAWMAVCDDGRVQGSVSGGCIESDLVDRVRDGEFRGRRPFVQRYGVTPDEARRYGLPCGGTMELLVEPAPDPDGLARLAERVAAGRLARRAVAVDGERARIFDGAAGDAVTWDGCELVTVHGPAWRLLIIGAGEIAAFLASMAQALDYRVFVCDPRGEYAAGWSVPGATRVAGMPDDAVLGLGLDPHSAVVALTHDPKLDDLALLEALKSPAFYVGALGSRRNNAVRRERLLRHFDLAEAEVDRLHGPVGLPIGSRTPPEIAVAILAEMTAVKNGVAARAGLPDAEALPATVALRSAGCPIG